MTLPAQKLISLSAAAVLGVWVAGCGKNTEANAPITATNQASTETQADHGAAVAAQVAPTPGAPTVSEPAELNRELRKWILRNRRPPKNFEEFASTAGIQIPPPPDGKRYAIDKTMHVVLQKR